MVYWQVPWTSAPKTSRMHCSPCGHSDELWHPVQLSPEAPRLGVGTPRRMQRWFTQISPSWHSQVPIAGGATEQVTRLPEPRLGVTHWWLTHFWPSGHSHAPIPCSTVQTSRLDVPRLAPGLWQVLIPPSQL